MTLLLLLGGGLICGPPSHCSSKRSFFGTATSVRATKLVCSSGPPPCCCEFRGNRKFASLGPPQGGSFFRRDLGVIWERFGRALGVLREESDCCAAGIENTSLIYSQSPPESLPKERATLCYAARHAPKLDIRKGLHKRWGTCNDAFFRQISGGSFFFSSLLLCSWHAPATVSPQRPQFVGSIFKPAPEMRLHAPEMFPKPGCTAGPPSCTRPESRWKGRGALLRAWLSLAYS